MSISFGVYDFFSYTIPGVLYIFAANELLRVFSIPNMSVSQLDVSLGSALFWVIIAYVVGQLMDTFGFAWYSLFNKFSAETKAMKDFKRRNANLEIDFNLDDRRILFSVVRHNKPEVAQFIDSFKAVSIMLNNISLALCLFGITELMLIAVDGFSLLLIMNALTAFTLSVVSVKRSRLFNEWHWSAVFEHARQYGRSVPEMFGMKK